MKIKHKVLPLLFILISCFAIFLNISCNYATHRILSNTSLNQSEDPEPDYNITLDENYQDYTSYIFMGNRNENFSTYFNKYFKSLEDFNSALDEYKTLLIANYNRRLDSIYSLPVLSTYIKDTLNGVIAKCSKIIQYNKSSRFLDASVLLIGKSYYYLQNYFEAERKFNEFLAKLKMSKLTDEALLYLGKTKLRLKSEDDALLILNSLIEKSENTDIKSEAAQELALYYISKKDYSNGINYIEKSIGLTRNKNNKAENQFLLARLYELTSLEKAEEEYLLVSKNTTDFDLQFYAILNYAKVQNLSGKYIPALELLTNLSHKYRDYPDFKQLADIEIANNLHYQKKFKESVQKYFDVILNYPNTKTSAEAYYRLARHYEEVENNYLKALISYKKVNEQSSINDFFDFSNNRVNTFNKYFDLIAVINDTVKGVIPQDIDDLEKYRQIFDNEKGIKNEKIKGKENEEKGPKGGGFKERSVPYDSLKDKVKDSISVLNKQTDSLKEKSKDTSSVLNKQTDSLKLILDKQKEDSLKIIQQKNEDSIKNANAIQKEINKYNAYLQLSEIFTYEVSRLDSAEFYIKAALNFAKELDKQTKANYFLATLYKNSGRTDEANIIYHKIIELNPNSIFANESRKILNLPIIEIEKDESDIIFKDAEVKIATNQYQDAIKILEELISKYPGSQYLPKALYSIGWIYENIYSLKDSTIYYYKKLQMEFPQSEYTSNINEKLNLYTLKEQVIIKDTSKITNDSLNISNDSTGIINDSLRLPEDSLKINNEIFKKQNELEKNKRDTLNPNVNGTENKVF